MNKITKAALLNLLVSTIFIIFNILFVKIDGFSFLAGAIYRMILDIIEKRIIGDE